jgi:hypothetical protein
MLTPKDAGEPADPRVERYSRWAANGILTFLLVAYQYRIFGLPKFYGVTEWLTYYPGHFIRRGLRGTAVLWLAQNTHLSPKVLAAKVYRPELDALRFVAFLMVYCHHSVPVSYTQYPKRLPMGRYAIRR